MRVTNKKQTLASRAFMYTADQMSKAALIDLCSDLLMGMHGDDQDLTMALVERANIVLTYRNDRKIKAVTSDELAEMDAKSNLMRSI